MNRPLIQITFTKPTDARGWIGFGCFILVLIVLGMIAIDKELLEIDAFLILATAIVITGWVQGPVGWAYQATKGGGEQAESTARIAEAAVGARPLEPAPDAAQAADQVADAAQTEADKIKGA